MRDGETEPNSETPEAQPPVSVDLAMLHETADALRLEISASVRSAVEAYREWRGQLTEELDSLVAHLDELSGLHEGFASELDACEVPDIEAFRLYWRATEEEVLLPVQEALASPLFGDWVTPRFERLLADIMSLATRFPENADVVFEPAILDAVQSDAAPLRIRKVGLRLRRRASALPRSGANFLRRVARRPVQPNTVESRRFAARTVAEAVLRDFLERTIVTELGRLRGSLAVVAMRLLRASSSWTDAVLVADTSLHAGPTDRYRYFADLPIDEDIDEEDGADDTEDSVAGDSGDSADSDVAPDDGEQAANDQMLPDLVDHLRDGLRSARESLVLPDAIPEDEFDRLASMLDERFAVAGTPLGEEPDTAGTAGESLLSTAESDKWHSWIEAVEGRMRYDAIGLDLRSRLIAVESAVLSDAATGQIVPVVEGYEKGRLAVEAATQTLNKRRARSQKTDAGQALADVLAGLQVDLTKAIEAVREEIGERVAAAESANGTGSLEWDAFVQFVSEQPDELSLLRLPDDDSERVAEMRDAVTVSVPEMVGTELIHRLPLRLKEPLKRLRAATRTSSADWQQIGQIVDFNLTMAIRDLKPEPGEEEDAAGALRADSDETSVDPVTAAMKVTVEGLERSDATALRMILVLREEWTAFCDAVASELGEDWDAIHRRLRRVDTDQRQWSGVSFRMQRRAEAKQAELAEGVGRYVAIVRHEARRRFHQIRNLIREGRAAVGVAQPTEDDRIATLAALSSVEELRGTLPRVYGHLFALAPISDPALLQGRARDLVDIRRHFERWRDNHRGGVLVVLAEPGTGRTSVMNVLARTVFQDADVSRVRLTGRVQTPDTFAAVAGKALGFKHSSPTLSGLEQHLLKSGRSESPRVCLVDNLEHLVLRALQATDVVGECLLHMSQSDRTVYWVATTNPHTWEFLSRANPTAVTLVDSLRLSDVTDAVLEEAIINRHTRSGLSLTFETPDAASALLRHRLRRARTTTDRQAVLRAEYFERLSRTCGQNFALALMYWMRSIRADEEEGSVHVLPLVPLRFDYLKTFSLQHLFTLKSFFVHHTLSVDDHARIYRLPHAASIALFESLLNQQIIEERDTAATVEGDYHVREGATYRIRPLLVHPVGEVLRARNLLY